MRSAVAAVSFVLAASLTSSVRADDTIKRPGDHPDYTIEVEPHGLLGLGFRYDGVGIGAGVRLSIPIVKNGFIPSINNSIAISFGGDLLHYGGCYNAHFDCSANYLFFPVAMQWNFFVAKRWSVFGEPGIVPFYGFYDDGCNNLKGCNDPSHFSVTPALYVGGRYHFNEHVALTMRLGYPDFSVGVSFL